MPSHRWKVLKGKLLTRSSLINSFSQRNVPIYKTNGELSDELQQNQAILQQQLSKLQEAYQKFSKFYSILEMFQQFEQVDGLKYSEQSDLFKSISQVLINENSASNLATQLLGSELGIDISHIAKGYDEAYQEFFKAYADSISLLEEVNYSLRGQQNLHHIGFLDDHFLKEFSLDEASMKAFRENGEMFKIVMHRNEQTGLLNASFRTRETLTSGSVFSALQAATSSRMTSSRLGVGQIQNSNLVVKLFDKFRGKELYDPNTQNISKSAGRYYEAFDEYLIKNNMDQNGMINQKSIWQSLMSLPSHISHIMDNLPWVSGGDNVFGDYTISNKFLNFTSKNAKIGKGGFGLSNLTTIFDTFDVLLHPSMMQQKYNMYAESQLAQMSENQLFAELEQWGYLGDQSINRALTGGAFSGQVDSFGQEVAAEINSILGFYGGSCTYE